MARPTAEKAAAKSVSSPIRCSKSPPYRWATSGMVNFTTTTVTRITALATNWTIKRRPRPLGGCRRFPSTLLRACAFPRGGGGTFPDRTLFPDVMGHTSCFCITICTGRCAICFFSVANRFPKMAQMRLLFVSFIVFCGYPTCVAQYYECRTDCSNHIDIRQCIGYNRDISKEIDLR